MSNIVKLIYMNLLNLWNINDIFFSDDKIRNSNNKKIIIIVIAVLMYGYFLYKLLSNINVVLPSNILVLGFLFSSLFIILYNISLGSKLLFPDNDYLNSLPIMRNELLISHMFNIYLKNMLFVIIIMFSSFGVFLKYDNLINETFVIMYLVSMLFVPVIPLFLSSLFVYLLTHLSYKFNKYVSVIIKYLIYVIILFVVFVLFKRVDNYNVNSVILVFDIIYPINILYNLLVNINVLAFVFYILFNIVLLILYKNILFNNYYKISSMIRGVNINKKFVYKRSVCLNRLWGLVRKELLNVVKNKLYFNRVFWGNFLISVILIIASFLKSIYYIDLSKYIYLFPTVLAMFCCLNCGSIYSFSFEMNNLYILKVFPVSFSKIVFSKWLTNFLIGLLFILVNGTIMLCFTNSIFIKVMNYLLPIVAFVFIDLLGIVLDFRFFRVLASESSVFNGRFISIVPIFVSLLIGIAPIFVSIFAKDVVIVMSYFVIYLLLSLACLIYLLVFGKKIKVNVI